MKWLISISALILSLSAYGHGGTLDSYGCHKNRKEGVYQCHEGAHAGKSYSSKDAMLISIGATTSVSADKQGNQSALINEITGKVVSIADGDTITVLMNKIQYKIRLAEIDTPERAQPYGSKSKELLSAIVFGKEVTAKVQDMDRYGRYVARIHQGATDVNRELVRLGAAWVYRQYLTDESLLDVENEAKAEKRGLWSLPESQKIPPWEWRR